MFAEFIKHIHSNSDGLIEFREITEAPPGGKSIVKKVFKTFSQLKDYEPPQDRHVYFGVYSRSKRSGTIKDCLTSNVLWADYDNMDLSEAKKRIEIANLPTPSFYVNSGNGIHAYWKLNQRAGHEAAEVVKAIAKATGSDLKATDVARIMRLPGTNNIKTTPKPCRLLEVNHLEYELELIKNIVNEHIEAKKLAFSATGTGKPCIDSMLKGVGRGHRNFALGRIVKHYQQQGYTRHKALEIALRFNDNCDPPKSEAEVITDFNSYWDTDYKLLGCKIDDIRSQSILSQHCNYINCKKSTDRFNIKLENGISYNNRTTFKDYSQFSGNQLIVLGILNKYPQGLNRSRLEQALYSPGAKQQLVNNRVLLQILEQLHVFKLIEFEERAKTNNRGNNFNNYFVKLIDSPTYGMGFTLVSNGAIMGAIDRRVTPGQYKLYVLLLKYAFGKGEAYPSTITLAKDMGTSQPNITRELKQLEKAGYLEISYVYPKGIKISNYRLLI